MTDLLSCLYAILACIAFSIMFETKKIKIIISCAVTGFISWLVYLIFGFLGSGTWNETIRFLIASVIAAIFAEIFARMYKCPATVFLTIGIVPLVPGGSIYYTMKSLIDGEIAQFTLQGLKTIAYAGAIAVGCSLVSSFCRMVSAVKQVSNEDRIIS